MAKSPPVFKIPPPPAKKTGSTGERGTFNAFINAHGSLKPYAGQIWEWANFYGGITPTQLAAMLWFESGGKPGAKSSVGALGLAQIYDTSANAVNAAGVPFFRSNRAISNQDKLNPVFAIRYAAWRMSGAVQKWGSVDQAYLHDYNPGYTGSVSPISSLLPKGYVGTPGNTIDTSAAKSVTTSQVTNSLKDPWVVLNPKGTFSYVNSTEPPKNAITYGGTPLTKSELGHLWNTQTGYADTYFAYTGRYASPKEIAAILQSGVSQYALANQLSGEGKPVVPGLRATTFQNSPVWKQHAPGLIALGKSILGQNWKPSGGIIRTAIAQNWDQATFESHIRQLPAYQSSPEFKTNLARNQSAFEAIYGTEDNQDTAVMGLLKQKTAAGWTPDEIQAWARQQPAYKFTPEYQSKQQSFLQSLGLITGQMPTLTGGQVDQMLNAPRQVAGAPYSSAGSQQKQQDVMP